MSLNPEPEQSGKNVDQPWYKDYVQKQQASMRARILEDDETATSPENPVDTLFSIQNLNVAYTTHTPDRGPLASIQDIFSRPTLEPQWVFTDVTMDIPARGVLAIIGPSGSGKSTFLRCLNRTLGGEKTPRIDGSISLQHESIFAMDDVTLRRRIGMVFQKPIPLPGWNGSIHENISFALRVNKIPGNRDELVEQALRAANLWDEVKDRFKADGSAYSISGGQQQRLCIARALATQPEALILDESFSQLDPEAVERLEELMRTIGQEIAVIIVTHNIQSAGRIADRIGVFLTSEAHFSDGKTYTRGRLAKIDTRKKIFVELTDDDPEDKKVMDFISGREG